MHLWPSMRIRDSFKHGYLKKLEWNLHRMNSEKKQQQQQQRRQSQQGDSNQQRLLDGADTNSRNGVEEVITGSKSSPFLLEAALLCGEILMVLSCCYCCFCCGACAAEDED